MSLKNDFEKIIGDTKTFINDEKITSLNNLADTSDIFFNKFQTFRKALSECAIVDGMSIDSILDEVRVITENGYDFSTYINNPEKVTCFATALVGISKIIANNSANIYKQLTTYKRGFLPNLSSILESMIQEFNPGNVSAELKNTIKKSVTTMMDVGMGFVQYELESNIIDIDKQIENYVHSNMKKIGEQLAFLFTVSPEFKYMFYLIFLDNLKTQTKNRINNLIKLSVAIKNIIYEISVNNVNSQFGKSIVLTNYLAALSTLESILPLNDKIKDDIMNFEKFDKVINKGIIGTLEKADKQLISQRNKFLEKLLNKDLGIFEDGLAEYSYILSEPTSKKLTIIQGITPIIEGLTNIPIVLLKGKLGVIDYILKSTITNTSFVITCNSSVDFSKYSHIEIDNHYYRITSVVNNNLSKNVDKTVPVELTITLLDTTYYTTIPTIKNTGVFQMYVGLDSSNYKLENKPYTAIVTDVNYIITESQIETRLNTFTLTNTGLSKVKFEWGDSKSWDIVLYLNYPQKKSIIKLNGEYPNLASVKPTPADNAFSELPEPLNSLYNDYKYYQNASDNSDKVFIGSYIKTGGDISEFMFGKDIVNGWIDKLGNTNLNYSKFLETATNVLQQFCPLKSSIYSYYNLLDQLSNIDVKDENVSKEINKKWILKINSIIRNTIVSMTTKNTNGEYSTIAEIKESPLYSQLLPSIILDHDNIRNLKTLSEFSGQLGENLNLLKNVENRFRPIDDLIKFIQTSGIIDKMKSNELVMWTVLSGSLVSSLRLMLKGEDIETLKPIMDNIQTQLKTQISSLGELYGYLSAIDIEDFSAQTDFLNLFKSVGLEHWADYIKEGKFDIFVKEKTANWIGKYSETIGCLNSLAGKYFTGIDKGFILNYASYLSYVNIAELLTMMNVGELELVNSVNANFLTKVSKAPLEDLKKNVQQLAADRAISKLLNDKKHAK